MLGGIALVSSRQWRRHKLRTLLTLFGIVIGVAAYFAVRTANVTLTEALLTTVEKMAGKSDLQVSAGESGFPEEIVETVRSTEGVETAEPAIETIAKTSENENIIIIGLDTASDLELHSDIVPEQGISIDNPLAFINRPDSIAVSRVFANRKRMSEGDKLELLTQQGKKSFTIRGIFEPVGVGEIFGGNVAVMDIVAMQRIFGRGDYIDRIDIKTAGDTQPEKVILALRERLPKGLDVLRPAQRSESLENAMAGVQVGMGLMSFLALAISIFIIFNSFFISVSQRWKEIGVLRALGADRGHILALFLGEAVVLGLLGSLIGIVAGYFLSIGVTRVISDIAASSSGFVSSSGLPYVEPINVLTAMMVGIAASVLGAWIPAREASGLDPVSALRNVESRVKESPVKPIRVATGAGMIVLGMLLTWFANPSVGMLFQLTYWLLVMLGMVLLLPMFVATGSRLLRPVANALFGVEGVIAVDTMSRAPRRTSATVGALMIGLAFVIASGTLIQSQKAGLGRTLDKSINADFFVTNSAQIRSRTYHFSEQTAERVASIKGVARAENLRVTSLKFKGDEIAVLAHDMDGWLTRSPNALDEGNATAVKKRMASGEGFFVSQNFAFRYGIKLGDAVSLETPTGTLTRNVLGILEYYQSEIGTIFLERELYKRFWGDSSLDYIMITAVDGADNIALKTNIEKAVSGEQQAFIYSHEEYRKWVMGLIDQFFTLNYVQMIIAILIGVLSLVNTMVISVTERKREISILRAMGGLKTQIKKMVVLEAIAISIIGIAAGLVAGLFNAYCTINISVVAAAGFQLPFRFPFGLSLAAIPIIIIVSGVAAWFPARRAAALNIADGIEYE